MSHEIESRLRAASPAPRPPDREVEERALAAALAELPGRPNIRAASASGQRRFLDPVSRRRTQLVGVGVAVAAVAVGAVLWATVWPGSSPSSDQSASSVVIGGQSDLTELFPSDTLTDLVSYADQVSIVSVQDEEALPADPADVERGEGYVGRDATLELQDTIWHREGAPSKGESLRITTEGWVLQDGRRLRFANWGAPRLEVGRQYVLPLVRVRSEGVGWTVLSTYAVLPFDGQRITTEGVLEGGPSPILEEVAGMTPGELAELLARTPPDPLAAKYAHLDPEKRVEKVFREKGLTD
ncbi:MAG: hypothetical protein ACRDWD_06935 [Acidimicrobiia bacterium]